MSSLSTSLAEEILGWEAQNGLWLRHGHAVGFQVAQTLRDLPVGGYWRPERSYVQVQFVIWAIWKQTGIVGIVGTQGGRIEIVFTEGDIAHRVWDDSDIGFNNEVLAEGCLHFWRERNGDR